MTRELTPLGGWLHQVERYVRRFVVLTDDQATAVALWVAHTHAFDAAVATAYISITSAEMESGKTRLLEVLRLLVAKPWFTGRTSTAALTRKIDKAAPTLLLDEGDPAFNGDREYAEALRGVLNTGYRRGGAVTVCIGQGANLDVKDFSTFCPKAIAGIGGLPDTVQSRSVPIRLKKRLASEPIERFREREARAGGEALHDALEGCFEDAALEGLRVATPELPDEISDRAQDVWEPLLALADEAGGGWPERAREAARKLSGQRQTEEATLGVRLLVDIRGVFTEDQLPTHELLDQLNTLDEAPWASWNDGDGIKAREVANKLRPYEIRSRDLRTPGGTRKGYRRADFDDAWSRYIPLPPDSKRDTRDNGLNKPETAHLQARQDPPPSRIKSGQKRLGQADVAGVADRSARYAGTDGGAETPRKANGRPTDGDERGLPATSTFENASVVHRSVRRRTAEETRALPPVRTKPVEFTGRGLGPYGVWNPGMPLGEQEEPTEEAREKLLDWAMVSWARRHVVEEIRDYTDDEDEA